MLLPASGRNGYLHISSPTNVEIPIYSWNLSVEQFRPDYRTSKSQLYPVRTNGLPTETMVVNGVTGEPVPLLSGLIQGEFGWIDWANNRKVFVPFAAKAVQVVYTLDYRVTANPSFQWTVNLNDFTPNFNAVYHKVFSGTSPIVINDHRVCVDNMCFKKIFTTDSLAIDNILNHIRLATITVTQPTLDFVTARSLPRTENGYKVPDNFIDFEIEGDFDYWYDKVNYYGTSASADDYTFQIDKPGETLILNKMKVLSMNNLMVDIQTAQMISATVRLGAAYG